VDARGSAYQEALPKIVAIVLAPLSSPRQSVESQGSALDQLVWQLRDWFRAIGYSIEKDISVGNNFADLIVNVPVRRGYDRVLIRAINGQVEVRHLLEVREAIQQQRMDEGWLISERRVSPASREMASKEDVISVYTLDELIDEYVDFSHYFEWLENEYQNKGIAAYYIPLNGWADELSKTGEVLGTSHYDDLADYLDQWIDASDRLHASILGEFGTGKTWLTLKYAHSMMLDYKEKQRSGRQRPRVPLIIQLRHYAKGFSDVGAMLSEFVFREHKIGLPSLSAFEQLNRMGRLLLIFDGFDEMAIRVDDEKIVDNFWKLAKIVVPGSKVILTSRTEHFHYARQEHQLFSGELQTSLTHIVLETPAFEIVHVGMFDQEQIREALNRRTDPQTAQTIMTQPQLVDLANRPILIELILEALEDLEIGKSANMAHIYYYATVRKMERDITAQRTFTSLADKLYFLCELAWEMYSTGELSLNYKDFPQHIKSYFGEKVIEPEEDYWHHDLLGQTMLVRDDSGQYELAHRSLVEFFVSYKLAAEMGALRQEFLDAAMKQHSIDITRLPLEISWQEYFQRKADESEKTLPPLKNFKTTPMSSLTDSLGNQIFPEAILVFLDNMIESRHLWPVVEQTCGKTFEECRYVGGNIATMLVRLGESFVSKNLEGSVLTGADFTRADMRRVNLRRSHLQNTMWTGTILRGALLQKTELRDAKFWSTDLKEVYFTGADLTNASFMNVDWGTPYFQRVKNVIMYNTHLDDEARLFFLTSGLSSGH
jgi:predicted NACHT family NTPase